MELFKSLEKRTKSFNVPFKHFEINQPLTNEAIKEINDAQDKVSQVKISADKIAKRFDQIQQVKLEEEATELNLPS